jgi:hypothetical protein
MVVRSDIKMYLMETGVRMWIGFIWLKTGFWTLWNNIYDCVFTASVFPVILYRQFTSITKMIHDTYNFWYKHFSEHLMRL